MPGFEPSGDVTLLCEVPDIFLRVYIYFCLGGKKFLIYFLGGMDKNFFVNFFDIFFHNANIFYNKYG